MLLLIRYLKRSKASAFIFKIVGHLYNGPLPSLAKFLPRLLDLFTLTLTWNVNVPPL